MLRNVSSRPREGSVVLMRSRTQSRVAADDPVTPLARLGQEPAWVDCPFCRRRATTRVQQTGGRGLRIVASSLCFFLGGCCAFIPWLYHWGEETSVYCTLCNERLAKIPRDGQTRVFQPKGTADPEVEHAEVVT